MQLLRQEPQMTIKRGCANLPKSAPGHYWHSTAGVSAAGTLFLAILVEEQGWKSIHFNGNLNIAMFPLFCQLFTDQALGNC